MTDRVYAGDSTDIWEVGFQIDDAGALANVADGFTCRLAVKGTMINREVTAVAADGKAFQAWLTAEETATLKGIVTVGIELRNPTMVPPFVREIHQRVRILPAVVPAGVPPIIIVPPPAPPPPPTPPTLPVFTLSGPTIV